LVQLGAGRLVIRLFGSRVEQLAALTLRHRLPTIFQFPEFTAAGGLMSYGPILVAWITRCFLSADAVVL
jgi:putative ABC transport system substrate-binding protein